MDSDIELETVDPELTGKFIKSIRKYHNLTQDELAEKLFITRKAVSKWETGVGFPSIDVAKRFCDIYGVSFEELIAGKYIYKKREIIFNSSLVLSTLIFFLLFTSIYSAYLNSFLIYKFSFEDKNINIVNNRFLVSNTHKYFNLGSVNINNKYFKNKNMYLEMYIKTNERVKIFSCNYIFGKCNNKFVNTNIKRKFLDDNLDNFYLKIKYKNKHSKVVILNKHIYVQKFNKVKRKINKNNSPIFILNLFGESTYRNDVLLDTYKNHASDSSNIKEIDLSLFYNMTKKELYNKYNGKQFRINKTLYKIKFDKIRNCLIVKSKNIKIIYYRKQKSASIRKSNYSINYVIMNNKIKYNTNNSIFGDLFIITLKVMKI